ncbi:phospholipase C [Streptomyces pseudovenezuelae]|uniref:Phospholipase C n=1 Tax=Streptomyces pseudovenezuelae TaxID=67350 RepID=A0ABT6LX19_9ACTN|nr:phospholipase C [Streptomyces pseudovenezuelae]
MQRRPAVLLVLPALAWNTGRLDNWVSGLTWQNYAEALQSAGVSWKVYQNAQDNYGDNACAYFKKFASARAGDPLYDRGMASVPKVTGSTPDDIAAAIKADVLAGTLPQVSWVVPNRAYSEHPYAPPGGGAHFVNLVHQALAGRRHEDGRVG